MIVVKVGGGEGNALAPALDELAALWPDRTPAPGAGDGARRRGRSASGPGRPSAPARGADPRPGDEPADPDGRRGVLVHGGSARLAEVSEARGHPPEVVSSTAGYTSRRTDRRTAEIMAMVYAGDVNTRVVEDLQRRGVSAVGLSGVDGRLLEATRKDVLRVEREGRPVVLRDDYTGRVDGVNAGLLRLLLDAGHPPVVSPPAISRGDEIVNVDGDRAAARVAAALEAEALVLLTGVPGLLRDPDDPSTRVDRLGRDGIEAAIRDRAEGRMRLKLVAAREALDAGVPRVVVGASDRPSPVAAALEGDATVVG